MNELPRQVLVQLVQQHGKALAEDSRLCRGLLNDALRNEHRKEMNVLVHAVEAKVVSDILTVTAAIPRPVLIGRLVQKLRDEKGTGELEARWAIETWLLAFEEKEPPPTLPDLTSVASRNRSSSTEPDGNVRGVKGSIETKSKDRLLSFLDKVIFPAVAGTEPRGSRRNRLECWRSALASCDGTPEALYAALAVCDSAIANGRDGPKVMAAIQTWRAHEKKATQPGQSPAKVAPHTTANVLNPHPAELPACKEQLMVELFCARCTSPITKATAEYRTAGGSRLRNKPVCKKCHEDAVKGIGRRAASSMGD